MLKKGFWLNLLVALPLVFLFGCAESGKVDQGRVVAFDKEKKLVNFSFLVDPGRKVYVRRINIAGNTEKAWRGPYFGIANEPWGCGGNMRPEYYADEYRKYNTFVKDYDRAKPIYRIAAGANAEDYRWTEVLMSVAGRRMDGLSLHYYTLPTGNWAAKGSATQFDEALWFSTLQRTLRMDELIAKHDAVMDQAEGGWKAGPRRGPSSDETIGLVVDEWGTWYDVGPGTEPGFLYQQNTLRDAVRASHRP